MPAASAKFVVYDDWSKGEFGELDKWNAPKGSFTGSNVKRYTDGTIGPRPGLRKHTVTGLGNGTCYGIGYIGRPNKMLLIVVGDTVYYTDVDTMTVTATAITPDLSATPTGPVHWDFYDPNGSVYLSNPSDKTYEIDWPAGTLASFNVAGSDRGFRTVKLYRDRLYLTDEEPFTAGNPPHRVYYSDAATFTSFPSLNYFDVGYFWNNYSLVPLGNNLLIPQRNSGWWALVSGSPLTGALRQISADRHPGREDLSKQHEVIAEQGRVWYWRYGQYLSVTNGSTFDTDTFGHLRLVGDRRYGLYLEQFGDVMFTSTTGNRALVRSNGAWSYYDFGVTISGPLSNTEFQYRAILVANGDGSNPPKLYSVTFDQDRPAFTSDTFVRPGDDSDTPLSAYLWHPLYRDPAGDDVAVRQVIVEGVAYATGSATANRVQCKVRTWDRYLDTDYDEQTQTWEKPGSSFTTTGTQFKERFNFQALNGSAFQIGLDLRGVKITRVIVQYDTNSGARRAS